MRRARIVLVCLLLGLVAGGAVAERLAIGQVDTGRLLTGQRVDLFVSADVPGDVPLTAGDLRISESADGRRFEEVHRILGIDRVSSIDAPLSFYLLVDNSGSMYDEDVSGTPGLARIDAARQAIRDFANSITNDRDRVGLAFFNTRSRMLAAPTRDKAGVGETLDEITRPERAEGYTELYAALAAAASDATTTGRRTVVVLSDGENYPYSVYENEGHPEYGARLFTPEDAISAFEREGLSLFAIHYGDREDPNLGVIAEATGGEVYRASGPEELAAVYREIRATLLDEYLVSYRATMLPAERRIVRVELTRPGTELRADRVYFANALFAGRAEGNLLLLIIPGAAGIIGLAVLLFISLRGGARTSSLVLVDSGGVRGLEKTVALGQTDTVIGASPEADVTIAGSPTVSEKHAVVTYEPKASEYTIVSDAPVRVNNQPTTKRKLKPGDVINIEGTIFAFDEPDSEKSGEERDS
jgi:Ca-activated chloride channel family protein